MALIEGLGLDFGNIGGGVLVFLLVMIGLILIGGVTAVAIWVYMGYKKYKQYLVVIWEKDAFGNINETYDDAGIFVDPKTNNKRLFLKRMGVGLEPDDIPFINMPGGRKKVYVLRRGLKNFQYIKPKISDSQPFQFQVTEEDVNWAINAYERQKKIFQSNTWREVLPYLMFAFVVIIILVIFIYFFKNFSVLKDVAIAFKEASVQLAQIKTGVIV